MKRNKFILCCCFIVTVQGVTHAQLAPRYKYTYYNNDNHSNAADFHTANAHKQQWIYRPSELPGLPAGPIRSVYFRVGRTYGSQTPNPTVYDSIRLKMGYTPDTGYKDTLIFGQPYYLYKTGLRLVFSQKNFTVYGADSIGTWVRFPIDGFSYNTAANLVVELSSGYQTINYGFDWMVNRDCNRCSLTGYYDSAYTSNRGISYQADIGFNDSTAGVGVVGALKGFYAYPNPSQGLFTVGFEPLGGAASTVQVSVSDMAGRQVWQRSYAGVRADLFTAQVDLRSRPKGIYLLRVVSGEAQVLQRVVVD